jgi:hypothetical protein
VIVTFSPMKRLLTALAAATLGGALVAGSAAASPDDQAAADAAIAEFNERMTEAGGLSSGPPDMEPVDPESGDGLPVECVGEFETALDAGGHIEGETARAFSDDFKFSADPPASTDPMDVMMLEGDDVNAGIVTVDEASIGALDELIELIGSEETATCLEGMFTSLMEDPSMTSDATGVTLPEFGFDVSTEFDLGIGDASARFELDISSAGFASQSTAWVARTGRSLVYFGVSTTGEPVSDFDGEAEIAALIDSL